MTASLVALYQAALFALLFLQSMAKKGFTDCVRRKRWVRHKRRVDAPAAPQSSHTDGATGETNGNMKIVGVVQPGAKLALPLGWDTNGRQLKVCIVPLLQTEHSLHFTQHRDLMS